MAAIVPTTLAVDRTNSLQSPLTGGTSDLPAAMVNAINAALNAITQLLAGLESTTGLAPVIAGDRENINASPYSIYDTPIRFVYPKLNDPTWGANPPEWVKGAIIEWGAPLVTGQTFPLGVASLAHADGVSTQYTVPAGIPVEQYRPIAWIMYHYDSPGSAANGGDIHNHLNFETTDASGKNVITRLQISAFEDIALVSFPSSDVKVIAGRRFIVGSNINGLTVIHQPSDNQVVMKTGGSTSIWSDTKWRLSPTQGNPGGRLDVREPTDATALRVAGESATRNVPLVSLETAVAGDGNIIGVKRTPDAGNVFALRANGRIEIGDGSATRDTNLYRRAANVLGTDDAVFLGNQAAPPATPTAGGVLYVEAGALKYKGSAGTVTTLGAA